MDGKMGIGSRFTAGSQYFHIVFTRRETDTPAEAWCGKDGNPG